MPVGSVNSNVNVNKQPVKKNSAKRTAAYIAAGVGTAAAVTGAVVYRKNIANAFKAFKEMFTPLKTTIVDNMSDLGSKIKNQTNKVKNKLDDGVEILKDKAAQGKEKLGETTEKVKDKINEGVDNLKENVLNSETAKNIKNEGKTVFQKTKEFLKKGFEQTVIYAKAAYNWVKSKVVNAYNKITTFFSNVKKEAAEQVTEATK